MIKWSREQIDVIAALMREGKSARQIARIVGVSHGAVSGIIFRNEKLRGIGLAHPAPLMRKPDDTARAIIRARLIDLHNGDPVIGLNTVRKERTLLELTSSQCRFPIWGHHDRPLEYLFCAEPRTDDSSYCTAHRKLCLNQPHMRSTP